MTTLPPAFQQALGGLSRSARYLVGVSGGRDSVCLLRGLQEAGFKRLVVSHLNHGLRGRESGTDARFVSALANKLGFPAFVQKRDVGGLAKTAKISLETAGRDARGQLFAEAGRAFRCHRLLLAHHADDQAETVLFQILRGTASPAGMRPMTETLLDGWKFQVIRPLLDITRAQIEALVTERQWKYREDLSNMDPTFTRNRLRREILPALAEVMGREVAPALIRLGRIAADEAEWMDSLTPQVAVGPLPLSLTGCAPVALVRRIIRQWLSANGVPNIGFREVESLRLLTHGPNGASCNLPSNYVARKTRDALLLREASGRDRSP